MRFMMNTYEIEDSRVHYASHPVLGPATKTLCALRDAADENSDGWAYWPQPRRAARKLMDLIGGYRAFDNPDREDATEAALRAAYRPIKAFRTRTGIGFDIYEPTGGTS